MNLVKFLKNLFGRKKKGITLTIKVDKVEASADIRGLSKNQIRYVANDMVETILQYLEG